MELDDVPLSNKNLINYLICTVKYRPIQAYASKKATLPQMTFLSSSSFHSHCPTTMVMISFILHSQCALHSTFSLS